MILDKNFTPLMEKIFLNQTVGEEEVKASLRGMLDGTLSEIRIAALLTALRFVPFSLDMATAIVFTLKEKGLEIEKNDAFQPSNSPLVDCGGTGGGPSSALNISTAAAIVAAAGGARVAKFAGRSLRNSSGSCEVLQALNISFATTLQQIETDLEKKGMSAFTGQTFFPKLKHLSAVRKTLGFKTIIDLLFPLCHPLPLTGQVVGTYEKNSVSVLIETLKQLGRKRALVVHGADGMDEISLCAPTHIAKLEDGIIIFDTLQPEDFGFKKQNQESVKNKNLEDSLQNLLSVFNNKSRDTAHNAVALNAAAVLWCAEKCQTLKEGVEKAQQILESGQALAFLHRWQGK